jgi:hypothetical protein
MRSVGGGENLARRKWEDCTKEIIKTLFEENHLVFLLPVNIRLWSDVSYKYEWNTDTTIKFQLYHLKYSLLSTYFNIRSTQ